MTKIATFFAAALFSFAGHVAIAGDSFVVSFEDEAGKTFIDNMQFDSMAECEIFAPIIGQSYNTDNPLDAEFEPACIAHDGSGTETVYVAYAENTETWSRTYEPDEYASFDSCMGVLGNTRFESGLNGGHKESADLYSCTYRNYLPEPAIRPAAIEAEWPDNLRG